MKCLQKSPGDRFAAVADLSGALQAAVSGVSFDDLSAVDPTVSAPETTQLRAYPDSPKPAEANIATRVSSSVAPKPAKRGFSRLLIGAALLTVCAGVFFVPRLLQFPLLPGSSETAPNRQLALVETLSGQSGAIGAAILSTDGQTLISAGDEKAGQFYPVKIWDLKTKQVGRLLEQHTGVVRSLAISEDGRILASAGDDQTIRIWDLTTGQLIKTLEGHTAPVQSIALSPDGETLISSSEDKTVRVWDLRTGASRTLSSHTKTVFSVALSADGKTIASGGEDKTIKLWDVATGELIRTLGEPGGHREAVRSVAFSPDGQLLVSGGLDGFAKLWNAATGQLLQTFEGHRDRVVSVTFVNQQTVASASYDNTIKLWNVQTGQLIQDIPAHSNWVLSVTAQPTESMLVSSSSDTTVKIWR
jgi:WD40 repeat protein